MKGLFNCVICFFFILPVVVEWKAFYSFVSLLLGCCRSIGSLEHSGVEIEIELKYSTIAL